MEHGIRHPLRLCLGVLLASHLLVAAPTVSVLGPFGGDVRSLAVHPKRPNTFFLGTSDGQIFVSRDAGQRWERLKPGLDRRNLVIDNLAFDPEHPDTVYAAAWELKSSQGWLFRSRDGGGSWEEVSLGRYASAVRAIAVAPSDPQRIALGITEGVILSLDGGGSWDRITRGYRSLHKTESLAFDPEDADTLYVGTWHLGWKTTDAGKSWEAIHQGMIDDSDMFSLLVNPLDTQVLYSSACTGIYKSHNGGLKWTKLENGLPKEARRTRFLHLDPSDPEKIYAGTTVGLYASQDGGKSWTLLLPEVVVNSVAVHPSRAEVLLVGTDDGGILRSEDGGRTFQPSNQGFVHRQVIAVASANNTHYYASVSTDAAHGGLFTSSDGGSSWRLHNQGLGEPVPEIRSILPSRRADRLYLGTTKGVFRGRSSGGAWEPVKGTAEMVVSDLTFSDQEKGLYLATDQGVAYLSLNSGELRRFSLPGASSGVRTLLYDPDSRQLFAGTETGLLRSADGGLKWQLKEKGLAKARIHVLRKNGSRLFAGTDDGLLASSDGGETWTSSPGVFPVGIVDVEVNAVDPSEMVAADWVTGNLFYSQDGGDGWEILNLGTSPSKISSLRYDHSGRLLAGTVSDGIYLISKDRAGSSSGR